MSETWTFACPRCRKPNEATLVLPSVGKVIHCPHCDVMVELTPGPAHRSAQASIATLVTRTRP